MRLLTGSQRCSGLPNHAVVLPGVPVYVELAAAYNECLRQLDAGVTGSHRCSGGYQRTCQERKEGKGQLVERHRLHPLEVCSLDFAERFWLFLQCTVGSAPDAIHDG